MYGCGSVVAGTECGFGSFETLGVLVRVYISITEISSFCCGCFGKFYLFERVLNEQDYETSVSDSGAVEGAGYSGAAAGGESADVAGAIHRQTKISKTTVYRVLKTFVHRGYLSQSPDGLYRRVTRPKKLRFGFGGQSEDMPFSVEVTESLKAAAAAVGVDLLILDNHYDAATALKNAEEFVRSRVDLVIEFQVEHEVAPVIGDRIAEAKIPLIAIDIPHPHATYFGVDNYRVGMAAGETLAEYAAANWGGTVEWVIGLDLAEAGQLVQSRITGAFEGVRTGIPDLPVEALCEWTGAECGTGARS